jgi:hypothetical protein
VPRNYPRQLPTINYWFVSEKKKKKKKSICSKRKTPATYRLHKETLILAINKADVLLLWKLLWFWSSGSISSVTTLESVTDN